MPPDTLTFGSQTTTQQFVALARRADSLRLAQRLIQVSDAGDAHDRLSPLVHLVGAADSVQTLASWVEFDVRLQPWASLSAHLWHADGLMQQFPKVYDAIRAADDYHGELSHRYLAAMTASRLPEGSNALLMWLRTAKLWLLVRAVDAAEAGYVFEPAIRSACDEIRLACESREVNRLPWLIELVGDHSPTDLEEFQSRIQAAANRIKTSGARSEAGQRKLVNVLAKVVEGNWSEDKLARAQPLWDGELAPWPTRGAPETSVDGAPPAEGIDDLALIEDDEDGDPRGVIAVDPKSTHAAQSAKVTSVLLVNQAEGNMLAWDWHSLIQQERFELADLVDSMLQSNTSAEARLGGALMAIAILTSSSARRIPRITTGRTSVNNWKVDVSRGVLHRLAARRDKRWNASAAGRSPQTAKWVRPLAKPWELQLAEPIVTALREAMPSRGRSLLAAWNAIQPDETFEHWVNSLLSRTPGLTRLSSPSLARAQRHCAFESTHDHALARLISSSSQTVLPAPCSYAAYTGGTVRGVLGPPFARMATWVTAASFAAANGAGSEMDVDSARIKGALNSLRLRVDVAAAENDWVKHHNLLTALCVIGLLACTGARPVNSPFQSITWFNFTTGLVYVDDKSAGAQSGSRLCILAPSVAALIRDTYVPYLQGLGLTLAPSLPDFGKAIEEVLQGSSSAQLPLFFFVKSSTEFDWTEVSELGLTRTCGDDWPLPWNFCRHRLATRLRRAGLDAEIIDALLGHGEQGSESHGPYSLRVLQDDLESARGKIADLTDELALAAPISWVPAAISFAYPPTRPLLDGSRPYGSESRRIRRDAAHELATVQATAEIQRMLNGKPPDSLSGENWEAIGRQMLLRKDGMPHAYASIRYAAFEKYLNGLWHEQGVRPHMRRRYTVPVPTRPLVSEIAVRAKGLLEDLRSEFDRVLAEKVSTRPNAKLARCLAAIDICLNGNIADAKLLSALAQGARVIPICHQGQSFIEVFTGAEWSDGMPLRRFAVSARSINWLLDGRDVVRGTTKQLPVPAVLQSIGARISNDTAANGMPALLKAMSRIVDQFNVISVSGFEAAVMAGRIKLSALPHSDLVRSAEAQALRRTDVSEPAAASLTNESDIGDGWDHPGDPSRRSPEGCRDLMRGIGAVLSSATERGSKAVEIKALLKKSPFVDGDLPFALGRWIVYVLGRDAKTHAGVLKLQTVERYFDALASKVTAVGYDAHLIDMDGDELTDLYYDLLLAPYFASVVRQRKSRDKVSENDDSKKSESTESGGDGYAEDRLVEFHQFAQVLHGLDDPDWSELGEFCDRPSGRPGLITTAEYLSSLESLVGSKAHRDTATHLLECAFVLMLGFRFGLRGGEAVGLDRSDWVEHAGAIVVLVHPNSTRGLKTVRGKRVVPLIEILTNLERSLIDEIVRRFDARPKDGRRVALLSDLHAANFKYRRMQIAGRLLRLLKLATLNPGTIVHHARHSFANRVFALLAGRPFGLGSEGRVDTVSSESTRRLLLGRTEMDRRAIWALCRLMGHSTPATLIKSYLHVQVVSAGRGSDFELDEISARPGLLDISMLARSSEYLKSLPDPGSHAPASLPAPTMAMMFNYLRLRSIGRPSTSAAFVIGIEPAMAEQLEEMLTASARRLEKVHAKDAPLESGSDLIGKIGIARYSSLVESMQPIKVNTENRLEPFEQFESTTGQSRQIVLFEASHFIAVSGFINELSLTTKDFLLVRPKRITEGLMNQITYYQLDRFAAKPAPPDERVIQVDTAVVNVPGRLSPTVYPARVGFKIVGGSGRFVTGYELIIGWCCYYLLRSFDHDPAAT